MTYSRHWLAALLRTGLISVSLMFPLLTHAGAVTITAEYTPSMLDPAKFDFVNTTPTSGHCARFPQYCRQGDFTVEVPISVANRAIKGRETERAMYHWYFNIDGGWKPVIARAADGTEMELQFRISMVGTQWRGQKAIIALGGSPGRLGSSQHSNSHCEGRLGAGAGTHADPYSFAWSIPVGPSECSRPPAAEADFVADIIAYSLGYELKAPQGSSVMAGDYSAQVEYTVGSGAQLDFGIGEYSTSRVSFRFDLKVRHDFRVDFPDGGNLTAALAPVGGWRQWIDYGRMPSRLQHELPFTLTSSSEFSVKMRCEHETAGRCAIEDLASGKTVPVDVDVTIPGMRHVHTDAPAINTALTSDHSGNIAPRFKPDSYLINRPSKLTFSANGSAVTEMLKAPASRWQGDVTVVFDSDP